jgi:hypothetical protein
VARSFPTALWIALLLGFGGLLGAAAFNPDDGFLLHSEFLWEGSGIASYAGFAGLFLIPVTWLAASLWHLARRIGRRHGNSA